MIYFNRKGLLYSFIQKETRVMNLALFMLTFMLSGLYATESYSQTVRISLNMKNSTVKEVLKKIENCSEFTFFYNDEIIDVDKRVTLNAEDLSISDILTTILPNCSYTISNKRIQKTLSVKINHILYRFSVKLYRRNQIPDDRLIIFFDRRMQPTYTYPLFSQ